MANEYQFTNNKELTVINLLGTAGVGKSTVMGFLYGKMKEKGYNVEMASEWVKHHGIYEARKSIFLEQDYIFAQQHRKLRRLLGHVDVAVTDSPLILGLIYQPDWYPKSFGKYVLDVFDTYNNINFFIRRKTFDYKEAGRVQNEQESKEKEKQLEKLLKRHKIPFMDIDNLNDFGNVVAQAILEETLEVLKQQKIASRQS